MEYNGQMLKFLYLTFVCEVPNLQVELDEAGEKGWRLHTCEPMLGIGGSGLVQVLVVMDQAIQDEEEEVYDPASETAQEGLKMTQ